MAAKADAIAAAASSGWQTEWVDRKTGKRRPVRQATLDGGGARTLHDFEGGSD